MPASPRPSANPAAWYDGLVPVLADGHAIELLQGGDEFFPALEAEIARATRSVHLETYIWNDDPAGRRIARALAAAADRGLEVRLVLDGFGTPALTGESAATLTASRVAIRVFRPEPRLFSLDRQQLRRLHRKLALVDGHTGFVGGINILDDRHDPNHGLLDAPRFDFAVRVQGPLVAPLALTMRRLWWELSVLRRPLRALVRGGQAFPSVPWGPTAPERAAPGRRSGSAGTGSSMAGASEAAAARGLRAMFVLRDNVRFRHTIEREYLMAIRRAHRDVIIANAYFFPGVRFRRMLLRAAARGVRVRLLLQGKVEYRLQHWATQALYDELLRGGIEIHEYQPSFLHAKVAVIDDWATVGSSNIDPFSLLLAREANVVVHDRDFAALLRARLEDAMAGCEPLALDRHASRPWTQRLLEPVAFALLRLGVAISGQAARW